MFDIKEALDSWPGKILVVLLGIAAVVGLVFMVISQPRDADCLNRFATEYCKTHNCTIVEETNGYTNIMIYDYERGEHRYYSVPPEVWNICKK